MAKQATAISIPVRSSFSGVAGVIPKAFTKMRARPLNTWLAAFVAAVGKSEQLVLLGKLDGFLLFGFAVRAALGWVDWIVIENAEDVREFLTEAAQLCL